MKIKHLTIALAAFTLYSCGSGTNQNTGNQNADTTAKNADTVAAAPVQNAEPVADEPKSYPIACEVALKYAEKNELFLSTENVKERYASYGKEVDEHPEFMEIAPDDGFLRLRCYPMKSGGYYVLLIWDEVCDCPGAYRYEYFNYKDGSLTKAKSLLPKPSITDFYANSDKFPKDIFNILKTRTSECNYCTFDRNGEKLAANFEIYEWDGEYVVPKPLNPYFEKKGDDSPKILYIWDGEKFVRDPENQPYEEDLSLFGVKVETAEEEEIPFFSDSATGDLNGDGIKDSVAFNKGFFVYFGGADGKYNLFKKYKVLDLESNDYITFKTSAKIDDGKLIISTRKNGDGWDNLDYTLKFQDGDFVLLKLYEDGGLDGSSEITYDFEARTYKGDFNEGEGDSYTTTAKLKNLPSPKLSDIVIGDPAYNFVDGYIDESTEKTKTR